MGRKLAELDLTAAEAEALVEAFGGRVAPEVDGFQKPKGPLGGAQLNIGVGELQECTVSKVLASQVSKADWFVADSFSFGVERE